MPIQIGKWDRIIPSGEYKESDYERNQIGTIEYDRNVIEMKNVMTIDKYDYEREISKHEK